MEINIREKAFNSNICYTFNILPDDKISASSNLKALADDNIDPFPNKPVFTCLQYKSFENTLRKGEIARTSNFSLSHSVFYPFEELSVVFDNSEIVVCKLFQFGRV